MTYAENDSPFHDRRLVTSDEQKRYVSLDDLQLVPPAVGVFDEPLRCYAVNHEWAKIITGAVSILLNVACWRDAEDDSYSGIQQVMEFLIGADCMDCNDVETCLQTSATILAIQSAINNNAAAIQQNAAAIGNNLQSILQNEADIAFNLGEINTLTDIALDHEDRIAALEAATPGSGSGGVPVEALVWEFVGADIVTLITNTIILQGWPADTEQLVILFFEKHDSATDRRIRLFANGDTNDANYRRAPTTNDALITFSQRSTGGTDFFGNVKIHVSGLLNGQYTHWQTEAGRNTGTADTHTFWKNTDLVTNLTLSLEVDDWLPGTRYEIYALRKRNVFMEAIIIPTLIDINFEMDVSDYQDYTYNDSTVNGLISATGGNPGACWFDQGAIGGGEGIDIYVDLLDTRRLTAFSFDYNTDYPSTINAYLFVDGINQGGVPLPDNDGAWHTFDLFAAVNPATVEGNEAQLKIVFDAQTNGSFTLDNLHLEHVAV